MSFNPRVQQGLNTKTIPKPLPKPEKKTNNVQGRTYTIVTMSDEDEKYMKAQLKRLNESKLHLVKLENQLSEIVRTNVKAVVSGSILGIPFDTMNDVSKEKLDLFSCNNNQFVISESGMREVIISLAKKYAVKKLNLANFQDKNNISIEIKFQGEALKILLKSIPETIVNKLALAESRVLALTNEESELVVDLSSNHHIEFEQF